MVVWAPKFDSYSDDVPIHLPREEPSYLTKFTLDLVSLSVREEKVNLLFKIWLGQFSRCGYM